jgi:uncharacterized membrane protein YeaQ/YmgE (transglycosylase-associated protein family)
MDDQIMGQLQAIQLVIAIVLFGIPIYKILGRAGKSRWWIALMLLSVIGAVIALWVIAFGRWTKTGGETAPST